jgi:hypothetical protein
VDSLGKDYINSGSHIRKEKRTLGNECFIPYDNLSKPMKELDRTFAKGILDVVNSSVHDRYMNLHECVNRLVNDYKKHGNLYIAFDFDCTVFDYHNVGDTFPKMEKLLCFLKENKFKLLLFTGNEGSRLEEIIKYCKDRGYEPDYVNENPIMKTTKPYYNILLDDRAGLREAYETIVIMLNIFNIRFNG